MAAMIVMASAALGCGFNRSMKQSYKAVPLEFRVRGLYKAVGIAGAATDCGERDLEIVTSEATVSLR